MLDDNTIGRVRGAKENSYTLGVVCEKVARYSERIHHPERLLHPLKRVGPKGSGSFARITWAEAKRISPPRKKGDSGYVGSPERTIVLRSGTTLRGDLVESVQGVHTTIRLGSGEIRRVLWSDIQRITAPLAPGVSSPIPLTGELLVHLDSGSRVLGTYFEYIPEQQLILRHPSGRIYYIPVNTIIKVTITDEGKTE